MASAEPRRRARRLAALLRGVSRLPEPLHRLLRGPALHNDRGDVLDRDLRLLCRLEGLQSQSLTGLGPDRARDRFLDSSAIIEGPPVPVAAVRTEQAAGPSGPIPLAVYEPAVAGDAGPLVYLHGGGWVVGDLRTHDRVCRRLAVAGRRTVIAVDYALAPEHPFPAGLEDAVAAFEWIRGHADRFCARPDAFSIGGDSAGGNLSIAACLALRDRGRPQPRSQVLVYPATDLRRLAASHQTFARGFLLTSESMDWYVGHYGAALSHPRATVLLEPDLSALAPAVVVTAGFDPLRDEGEALAAGLREAGVPVAELRFGSLLHGFLNMAGAVPAAERALLEVVAAADAIVRG